MDDPVTVRDVMNRTYVGVSEADTVAGAAQLMAEEGVHSAVVLRGSDPVGVIDEDRLLDLVADRRDPTETAASEVMRPVVTVDADRRLEQAVGVMTTDGIRHLLVEDDGELVGSVSEHDILTAHAVLTARPEPVEVPLGNAGAADLGGNPERDVYSTQGVCESCGSLTRDLANLDGQLLCPDCVAL